MKYISLNTHSWIETDSLKKMQEIAEFILANDVDMIALQEVNQLIKSPEVLTDSLFCPLEKMVVPVKADNYALLLVEYLKSRGKMYYWSWTCSHIGYDIYDEGSAILSKYPFKAQTVRVSKTEATTDYHTRQILLAHLDGDLELTIGSCHFSWWDDKRIDGFYHEWQQLLLHLEKRTNQVILLGDFNTPAHLKGEGYSLVTESFLDSFDLAKEKFGSFTVPEEIDGWKGNKEPLRIDFGFVLKPVTVLSYQVIFNEKNGPIVSDHFGIMIEINS